MITAKDSLLKGRLFLKWSFRVQLGRELSRAILDFQSHSFQVFNICALEMLGLFCFCPQFENGQTRLVNDLFKEYIEGSVLLTRCVRNVLDASNEGYKRVKSEQRFHSTNSRSENPDH